MQPNILMADPQKLPTKIINTIQFIQNSRLHAFLLQVTYTFNPTLRGETMTVQTNNLDFFIFKLIVIDNTLL